MYRYLYHYYDNINELDTELHLIDNYLFHNKSKNKKKTKTQKVADAVYLFKQTDAYKNRAKFIPKREIEQFFYFFIHLMNDNIMNNDHDFMNLVSTITRKLTFTFKCQLLKKPFLCFIEKAYNRNFFEGKNYLKNRKKKANKKVKKVQKVLNEQKHINNGYFNINEIEDFFDKNGNIININIYNNMNTEVKENEQKINLLSNERNFQKINNQQEVLNIDNQQKVLNEQKHINNSFYNVNEIDDYIDENGNIININIDSNMNTEAKENEQKINLLSNERNFQKINNQQEVLNIDNQQKVLNERKHVNNGFYNVNEIDDYYDENGNIINIDNI